MINIIFPFEMYGEYEDGNAVYVGGFNEADCMYWLLHYCDTHGKLTYYTLCNGDGYVDGE